MRPKLSLTLSCSVLTLTLTLAGCGQMSDDGVRRDENADDGLVDNTPLTDGALPDSNGTHDTLQTDSATIDEGTGADAGRVTWSCQGLPPVHATLCPEDDEQMDQDVTATAVSLCSDTRKCEYRCNPNYMLQDGTCVIDPDVSEICEAPEGAHCYYIAPNGSDSDSGTFEHPFASTNPIIDQLDPGDVVYFRGGSYGSRAQGQIIDYASWLPEYYSVAYINRSGQPNRPISFKAYPGELPILDLELINPDCDTSALEDCTRDAFHVRGANHIRISGFEIVHGSIVVANNADYVWIENNHIHDLLTNRDNNGLIMLNFAGHVYVRNNHLHDTYSRIVTNESGEQVLNSYPWSHEDAQHNGCITTLSGDCYVGYGNETSGPFEFTGNDIHDCPVHLFIKNPQGESVNNDGINMLITDNYFHGAGTLAITFQASNVLFENNLFEGIGGITRLGTEEQTDDTRMNEITARNITFRYNVFTQLSYVAQILGLGYLVENGIYSTEAADKLKFHNNVAMIRDENASTAGTMSWTQGGYVFGNSYTGMIDTSVPPSKTLSRIDSQNNCIVNKHGTDLAFLKHGLNEFETITGYDHATAQTVFGINGSGDLFPDSTSLATHFADPSQHNYAIKKTSPCAAIENVGLRNPSRFVR